MPRTRAAKEDTVSIKEEAMVESVEIACKSEDQDQEKDRKYRAMKRKLIELIARKNEYQATIDRANKRIQALEKKNRQLQQKRSPVVKKNEDEDAMDISQPEEDESEDANGVVEDEIAEEEEEEEDEEEDEEDQLDEDDDVPVPKKKRLSRKRRVEIPRDQDGKIELPFQVASLNIISLGKIDTERTQYHNDRYIFPIGYTAERTYMSMIDPSNQTTYTCRVEDGGDGPLFTLQAADAPEIDLSARTATGVWALVIKRANEARQKESSNAISGPEYYGFSNPVVIEMIEELDGVDECVRYKRRHKSTD